MENQKSLDFSRDFNKKIEQVMGIEPTYLAWKASVLPLNYTCMCPEPESNQRHEDFQSSALPTELSGQFCRFELTTLIFYPVTGVLSIFLEEIF